MTKPAGQEAQATEVPPATAASDDPFGLAPWLKEMPNVAIPPLMAHPVAAMAAATAIGFGLTSQLAGAVIGAMQGSAERMKAALDAAAEAKAPAMRPTVSEAVATVAPERAGATRTAEAIETAPVPARDQPVKGRATGKRAPVTARATTVADERPAAAMTKKAATVRKGSGPKAGRTDDLKAISGVGPKLEQALNGKGIFRFAEIARWTGAEVAKIEAELGLDGRIARDGWVEQARALAKAKG